MKLVPNETNFMGMEIFDCDPTLGFKHLRLLLVVGNM